MSIVGMEAEVPPNTVVIVIDVIRAFTTAAIAFERGATEIVCAPSAEVGRNLRLLHPDHLLVGEINGLKPADFDFGNSPFEMSMAQLDGRRLIQTTSNGTRGLVRYPDPAVLLAVSALNVGATARWIRTNHAETACTLVCTGRTAEDQACARYLSGLLQGSRPRRTDLIAGIMEGAAEHVRAYARQSAPERVDLSKDLPICCDVDRSEFAMVGEVRRGPRRANEGATLNAASLPADIRPGWSDGPSGLTLRPPTDGALPKPARRAPAHVTLRTPQVQPVGPTLVPRQAPLVRDLGLCAAVPRPDATGTSSPGTRIGLVGSGEWSGQIWR
ncbi:2-phosphosulfolactate phosphatase [Plantactinospora sp. BC1]|uniref:2-phosphosulfolactate phosphatase n=1 Tax=Plantactinospora sp. BC1 TaxID=2108470 RepID=UPI00131F22E8|nr:2-phosphosulfolactate phosphatase [Plantactinospora sp. BC1]